MGKLKDLTGRKFARLTVLKRIGSKKGHATWLCECECKGLTTVKGASLLSGKTKSCGCSKYRNLEGQVFGHLTVLKVCGKTKNGSLLWLCSCVCGNEVKIRGSSLGKNKNASCGCYKSRLLIGKKFGRLLVLESIRKSKGRHLYYKCLCDCGNTKEVLGICLKRGSTKSCGCYKIESISGENNVNFIHGLSSTKEYKSQISLIRERRKKSLQTILLNPEDIVKKFNGLNNECVYCCEGVYEHADHVIPLSRGGSHSLINLLPACKKCNLSKNNRILFIEWQPERVHPILESTYRWIKRR